jgi:Flp pilus assembly protein TadG
LPISVEIEAQMNISVAVRHFFSSCFQSGELNQEPPRTNTSPRAALHPFSIHPYVQSEGSSLIEFAVVMPMMFALIMGMFWFGLAINNYIVLTDAVAVGARSLALADGQTNPALAASDPCAYAVQQANNDATILNTANITYKVSWTPISQGNNTPNQYTNSCPGITLGSQDIVQLQASYPVPIPLWVPNSSLSLKASATEMEQ